MSKENTPEEPNQESNQVDLPEVEQELSKVATNPKQSMLIMIGLGLVFVYLFFNLFINSGDIKPAETPVPEGVVKPAQVSADSGIPTIPGLPSPPKLEDPTPPPPPPPSLDVAATPPAAEGEPLLPADSSKDLLPSTLALPGGGGSSGTNGEDAKKRLEAKRKSSIVLVAGRPETKTPEQIQQEADFKFRGDMYLILGRGKMIDAVIETAINTDFGGEIRAIISRDVYSEWGRNILIPKGSRAFGSYVTGINGAYGRVAIEWNRVDLATGYTINLSGTGTDKLGRKGEQGRVDNKFKEQFTNAILRSAFNITLASALDNIVPPVKNSQAAATQTASATAAVNAANAIFTQTGLTDATKFGQICATVPTAITDKTSAFFTAVNTACTSPPPGATDTQKLTALMSAITLASNTAAQTATASTEPSKAQKAAVQAFTDIGDLAKEMIAKQKFEPTITIDQGTAIKIYVNKDYKFPKAAVKKVMK